MYLLDGLKVGLDGFSVFPILMILWFCMWAIEESKEWQPFMGIQSTKVWCRNTVGQDTTADRSGDQDHDKQQIYVWGVIQGTVHACQNILFPKFWKIYSRQRLALSAIWGCLGWTGDIEKGGSYVEHRWENRVLTTEIFKSIPVLSVCFSLSLSNE